MTIRVGTCVLGGLTGALVSASVLSAAPAVKIAAEPLEGEVGIDLVEVWRLDGEGELLMGVISDAARGPDGTTYLLDSQLHEIQVISPEGEHIRTIGREGEGPGEFQRAWGLIVLPSGEVGVLQRRPGKIVLLEPTGEPAGDIMAPGPDGSTAVLIDVQVAANRLYWRTSVSQRNEKGFAVRQTIVQTGLDGSAPKELAVKEFDREFSSEIHEVAGNGYRRWAVTANGTLFLQHGFDEYEFEVVGAGQDPSFDLSIEHTPHQRTEAELEAAKSQFFVNAGVQIDYIVSPTDPATLSLDAREDGNLWVLTSDGARRNPSGTVGVWDVISPGGRFLRRVTLHGEGAHETDGFEFLGPDHFIIIEEQRSATRASMGAGDESDGEDAVPLSVVCYRMDPIPK